MKSVNKIIISAIGLCVIGLCSSLAVADRSVKGAIKSQVATNVSIAKVMQMAIPKTVFSVGRLIAIKSAALSSEVDGRIAKIYFQNGDFVEQGQAIIQLDDKKAKADLFSAQAAYQLSQTTYNRYVALLKEGGVSQQTIDQQKSDLESKEAAVQTEEAALQQKTIQAPFSGVLGVFNVTQGAYIKAGQSLVKLVDKKQIKVQYTIPQRYLAYLKLGQVVSIHSDSYPNKTFRGEVSYIAPSVDDSTGSVTVQATIANNKNLLSPGMFVTLNQIVQENPQALVIPEQAVMANLQGNFVFVIKKKHYAKKIKIKIGDRRSGYIQVLKGLHLGEQVIIAGQQKLHSGSAVNIVSSNIAMSFVYPIQMQNQSWLQPISIEQLGS